MRRFVEKALANYQAGPVYRQFIERAHDHGIRVVGATLTPYGGPGYYTDEGEKDRQAVNFWIRTSGEFDAVVDFDAVVRDPRDRSRLQTRFDPGAASVRMMPATRPWRPQSTFRIFADDRADTSSGAEGGPAAGSG